MLNRQTPTTFNHNSKRNYLIIIISLKTSVKKYWILATSELKQLQTQFLSIL